MRQLTLGVAQYVNYNRGWLPTQSIGELPDWDSKIEPYVAKIRNNKPTIWHCPFILRLVPFTQFHAQIQGTTYSFNGNMTVYSKQNPGLTWIKPPSKVTDINSTRTVIISDGGINLIPAGVFYSSPGHRMSADNTKIYGDAGNDGSPAPPWPVSRMFFVNQPATDIGKVFGHGGRINLSAIDGHVEALNHWDKTEMTNRLTQRPTGN